MLRRDLLQLHGTEAMSFILDALKKADSERHLGRLPGLHTPAVAPALLAGDGTRWWQRTSWVVTIGAGAAVLAGAAWYNLHPALPNDMQAPVSQSVAGTSRAASPSGPVALAPPPPPASIAPMVVATVIPVPPALPKPIVPPRKEAVAQGTAKPPVDMPAPKTVPKKSPGASDSGAVVTLADLPPNIRSELPVLAIGGSMYSADPAQRMLLVDKRMLREGDEIAPGLLLESVLPKGAMLRYKGFRFRITN